MSDFYKNSFGYPSPSPESYRTAPSSLSTYFTPSSGPARDWYSRITRVQPVRDEAREKSLLHDGRKEERKQRVQKAQSPFESLVCLLETQIATILDCSDPRIDIKPDLQDRLRPLLHVKYHPDAIVHELVDDLANLVEEKTEELYSTGFRAQRKDVYLVKTAKGWAARDQITPILLGFCSTWAESKNEVITEEVFSSEWLDYLRSRGIILDARDELDWSNRGQHVEFAPEEEAMIPLQPEKILGHSSTAIVESVRCRRIRLARKKIRCVRRLSKEVAVIEVEHLQRLHHWHILRVVGTYTHKKDLAILLYPVTDYNLEEYMDDIWSGQGEVPSANIVLVLGTFTGCLSAAVEHIHSHNVKHLDIKPQNLLIRTRGNIPHGMHKVFIADFGIARSYKSAADSETDSPVSFTRAYAAPEVLSQSTMGASRGFKADIFSLGCVFIEIALTMLSSPTHSERQMLLELRSHSIDTSFHANMDKIMPWFQALPSSTPSGRVVRILYKNLFECIPDMVSDSPAARPTAAKLAKLLAASACGMCNNGPEPFAAADRDPSADPKDEHTA